MKKIVFFSLLSFCAILLCDSDAVAGKVNVNKLRWWAMVEKLEISQNRGQTYYTVFEGDKDVIELTSELSSDTFFEENSEIPEGTYNYFRLTLTVTLWKVVYDDTINGPALITPDIDDRKTYEVTASTSFTIERDDKIMLYLDFDTPKSLRDCEARWNGVSYSLEDLNFVPEVSIHE